MKTFSALLYFCEGSTCGSPSQRPVTRSFHIFFDVHLNTRLSRQSRFWWFETPWHPLWCHCNAIGLFWYAYWAVGYSYICIYLATSYVLNEGIFAYCIYQATANNACLKNQLKRHSLNQRLSYPGNVGKQLVAEKPRSQVERNILHSLENKMFLPTWLSSKSQVGAYPETEAL